MTNRLISMSVIAISLMLAGCSPTTQPQQSTSHVSSSTIAPPSLDSSVNQSKSPESITKAVESATQTIESTTVPIEVSFNGGVVANLTLTDIAKLPQFSVKANNVVRTGPELAEVIQLAGIFGFVGVTVYGYSLDHSKNLSIDLTDSDFSAQIILSLDHGNIALFGPNVLPEYWDMVVTGVIVVACGACEV
jgi:outer membrane murein-binding lipoprotein Lpp